MTKVVDIFAGPGGLGEGFSQAGFNVILSAEMDPVACETLKLRKFFYQFEDQKVPENYYKFLRGEIELETMKSQHRSEWNCAENAVVNVELGTSSGNEILNKKLDDNLHEDENFILIGGPPCQAYSMAGRSRMLGLGNRLNNHSSLSSEELQAKLSNEFYSDKRHTLYKEYLKIICRYQPSVFVMENVRGMGSARSGPTAKSGSVFSNIIHGLKNPYKAVKTKTRSKEIPKGYKIYPIIENGNDLFNEKEINKPEDCLVRSEKYGVPQSRHRIIIIGVRSDLEFVPEKLTPSTEMQTVRHAIGNMPEIRSGLSREPDSEPAWRDALIEQIVDNLVGFTDFDDKLKMNISNIKRRNSILTRGAKFFKNESGTFNCLGKELKAAINDPRLKGVIQHESRSHIRSDLLRYFFVSLYGEITGKSPTLDEWIGKLEALIPKHNNINLNQSALSTKAHKDRFKVQLWNTPSSTVVSHISKDGHYFIHPDPTQCRSLTVREAARLQTFPDNFYFCGTRTQQYHQVGNAVPVLLAKKIASLLAKV